MSSFGSDAVGYEQKHQHKGSVEIETTPSSDLSKTSE
jgi:hypothetical protein